MFDRRTHSAAELELLQKREQRERLEREEARATRESLERSSSGAPRLGIVNFLNGEAARSERAELPPIEALQGLRKRQNLNRVSAAEHNREYARLGFDRLHPDSLLESRVSSPGARHEAPSIFNHGGPDEPGNTQGSRFGHDQRYAPTLRAGRRVGDAAGSLRGGNPDHWSSGEVEPLTTEQDGWLLEAARRLIEIVRQRRYAQGRV